MDILNHPNLVYKNFNTIMLSWQDGGLRFFKPLPSDGSGALILDTYYCAYLICFIIGLFLARHWVKTGSLRVRQQQAVDLAIVAMGGVLIGAKLAYVLFYNFEYYMKNPAEIFLNWSGMASHGAITGAILAIIYYARRNKIPVLHVIDHAAIVAAICPIFIRFANFLNGELYGRSVSSSLPWSMRFGMSDSFGRPLFVNAEGQLYSLHSHAADGTPFKQAFGELLSSTPSHAYESYEKIKEVLPHQIWKLRINSEDGPLINVARLITDPSHPSQFYQLILSGFILLAVLLFIKKKTDKIGVVTASFLIGYGVSRVFVEFFRQQDIQRSEGLFQLISMGQILSLLFIISGLLVLKFGVRPFSKSEIK